MPRTLAEAKGWGLVRRESSAAPAAARRARGRCSARSATSRRSLGYGAPRARRGVDDVLGAFKRIDRLLDGVYVSRRWRRGRRQTYAGEAYERAAARARTRARASAARGGPRPRRPGRARDARGPRGGADRGARRRSAARHATAPRSATRSSASRTTSTCARGVRYHYAIDSVYFSRRWRGGKPPI